MKEKLNYTTLGEAYGDEGVKTFGAEDKNNEGKMNVKEIGNLRPFFNSEKSHMI